MSAKPKLYLMTASPPCRFCVTVANILGVPLELITVNLLEKEQFKDELAPFLPFKKVPSFVDTDGFALGESRAIGKYLVESRGGANNSLYPADIKKRALIDQYLQFDLGHLYRAISDVVYELFQTGKPNLDKLPRMMEVLECLETSMKSFSPTNPYLVGNGLTLADISVFFTLSLLDAIESNMDWSKVPKLNEFSKKIEAELKKFDNDGSLQKGREELKAFSARLAEKAAN